MARTLDVFLHGEHAGRLTQDDSGRIEFRYTEEWRVGPGPLLSLSLPVREAPFGHRESEAFFGGLLPEEGVRERAARYLGVTSRNDFAMLEQIGGECAGAVALVPEGERPADEEAGARPVALAPEQLAKLLDELPRRPLMVGGEVRLSLAGAQDKLAVSLVDGQVALPVGSEPTTHILKTPIVGFDATVANELLCLRTAARLGLPAATAERRVTLGREFLLVERFDRTVREGRIARIHQEDMCQALGVPTRMKYQSEGGPTLPQCFELLTRHVLRPAIDRLLLLRASIFNVLVGNADAHAKNFSLAHAAGSVTMTPLYDLLSTLVYEDLSPRYAMKIGSRGRFDQIRLSDWDALASGAGLAPAQVRRELREACGRLPAALEEEAGALPDEQGNCETIEKLLADTRERCEITQTRMK